MHLIGVGHRKEAPKPLQCMATCCNPASGNRAFTVRCTLSKAHTSICRTRSRETPNSAAKSSSVTGSSVRRRASKIRRSRRFSMLRSSRRQAYAASASPSPSIAPRWAGSSRRRGRRGKRGRLSMSTPGCRLRSLSDTCWHEAPFTPRRRRARRRPSRRGADLRPWRAPQTAAVIAAHSAARHRENGYQPADHKERHLRDEPANYLRGGRTGDEGRWIADGEGSRTGSVMARLTSLFAKLGSHCAALDSSPLQPQDAPTGVDGSMRQSTKGVGLVRSRALWQESARARDACDASSGELRPTVEPYR
jgi:hypothetical protein